MGLPSLEGVAASVSADATLDEKLLRIDWEGDERGEALGLRGALSLSEAARALGAPARSGSEEPIPVRVGRSLANLVTSGADDGPR